MKYSIIVCSYNSAKTLSNCLQSIECQTYKDYEVIFIDDGKIQSIKIKENNDETLLVTFSTSGEREILWHVFKWGSGCKVLSPKALADRYKRYLEDNLNNYQKP